MEDKQTSSDAEDRRLRLAAVGTLVGGTLLLAALGIVDPNQFVVAVVSTLYCLVSLTSFWTVYAQASFPRRIAVSMLPGGFIGLWILNTRLSTEKQILGYIAVILSLPIISLPGFGLQAVGFRLVRFVAEPKPSSVMIDHRPVQFSLRQLIVLGVVVSGIALLGKLLVGDNSLDQDARATLAIVATFAFSNAAVALSALASRHAIRAVIAVATASALLVLAIGQTMASSNLAVNVATELAAMNALLTGAVLLLLRRQGYRLVRVREPPAPTSAAAAVPTQVD